MSLQVWLFDEQERGGKFKRPEVTFWIEERPSQIRRLFFYFDFGIYHYLLKKELAVNAL